MKNERISLKHPFRFDDRAHWTELLDNVKIWEDFEKHIKKISGLYIDHFNDEEKAKHINSFKGDAFEVFGEMLLQSHPFDTRIGISYYIAHHREHGDSDHGVDGRGTGTNGRSATVQFKFRSDPTYQLTANKDHLSNFVVSSQNEFCVDKNDNMNMLIITNCQGLQRFTKEEMFNNKVRCIGRVGLRQMVDNNIPFWDEFRLATTRKRK